MHRWQWRCWLGIASSVPLLVAVRDGRSGLTTRLLQPARGGLCHGVSSRGGGPGDVGYAAHSLTKTPHSAHSENTARLEGCVDPMSSGRKGQGKPINREAWPADGPQRYWLAFCDKIHRDNGMRSLSALAAAMGLASRTRVGQMLRGTALPADVQQAQSLLHALGAVGNEVEKGLRLYERARAERYQAATAPDEAADDAAEIPAVTVDAEQPSCRPDGRQVEVVETSVLLGTALFEAVKNTRLRPTRFGLVGKPWWEPVKFDRNLKADQHSFRHFVRILFLSQWRPFSPIIGYAIFPSILLGLTFVVAKVGPAATWPWLWKIQEAIGQISAVELCALAFGCGALAVIFDKRNQAAAIIFSAALLLLSTLVSLTWANYLEATADASQVAEETEAWHPVYLGEFDQNERCPDVFYSRDSLPETQECSIEDDALRIKLESFNQRAVDRTYGWVFTGGDDYYVETRFQAPTGNSLSACGVRLATDRAYYFVHAATEFDGTAAKYMPEMLQIIYGDGGAHLTPVAPVSRLAALPFVGQSPQWPGASFASWTKIAVLKKDQKLSIFVNDRLAIEFRVDHGMATPSAAVLVGSKSRNEVASCVFDYFTVRAP